MGEKRHQREKHHREHHGRGGKRLFYIVAIAIAVILIVGGVVFVAARNGGQTSPGTLVPSQGNRHINDQQAAGIRYNTDPPTSGPHYGAGLARWGIHTQPVPKGLMVHNLEDGGVVISYRPDVPQETVNKLAQIVRRYEKSVILAPYPGLDSLIALTAWQRIDKLDTLDEARIVRFIEAYKGIDHHVR